MTDRQPPTARELVLGFLAALDRAEAALCEAVPPLERLADILAAARSGRISRSGEAGGYAYLVHGAGCRMTDQAGVQIDVDFIDGTAAFDLWRLRCYGRSLATPVEWPSEEPGPAVRGLDDLLVELRPGWFAPAGSRADALASG
ncbi:DUF6896 domain-containing protein [Kitasatospora sp. NPDC001225]